MSDIIDSSDNRHCSDARDKRRKQVREAQRRWRAKCRKEHAEQQREWRSKNPLAAREIDARKRENMPPDQRDRESQLSRERNRKRNANWEAKIRRHCRWQDWEVRLIFDSQRLVSEIAIQLGRSYKAIEQARVRYRDRAPIGWKPRVVINASDQQS